MQAQCASLCLQWTVQLDTDVQLEAKTQVRKLEEEFRLETDMWLSSTLLDLGLADKVREQDNEWGTLVCHFSKFGVCKLPRTKVLVLVTKLN